MSNDKEWRPLVGERVMIYGVVEALSVDSSTAKVRFSEDKYEWILPSDFSPLPASPEPRKPWEALREAAEVWEATSSAPSSIEGLLRQRAINLEAAAMLRRLHQRATDAEARIAALTALCTFRPDIAAVLRGEATVVPRGAPTPDMRRLIWLTQYSLASEAQTIPASFEMVVSLTERRLNDDKQRESDDLAYRAMLEASPYAVKETPDAR